MSAWAWMALGVLAGLVIGALGILVWVFWDWKPPSW